MKKRAGALILTIIYLFCASPIVAATGGKKVIRVGFPEQHGFTMTADDGTHSGYTYDYLQEIAQYTGWEFAIVPIEGATENEALTRSLKMLESGELDLLGCISKNSYTEKTFELTNFSYGSVYSTVYVRENDTRYNKNDYQTLNGMSIALVKSKEEQFQSFCKANNITAKTVIVEGSEQLFAAVASGETDACLALDVSNTKGLRPVARYPGQPFYFAATKGKSDIITALNQAILNISQSEMDFSLNLYNKYFNPPRPAVLTDSERQFIGNIGTLRLATVEEGAPVQYFDKNGRAQGISQQIIQLVSNRTGLKVEFVRAQTYEQAYALVDEKKADGVLGVPYDYNVARKNGLVLTKPFLTSPMSLVVGPNTDISKLPELTCALLDGTPGGAQVAAEKLRYYENADALMKAVLRGEADYGYACNYAVEYSARKPAYKKLMLLSSGARTREYCVGLSRSTDLRCVSILNKIFGSISSTELQKIIFSSTAETDENISLGEYVDSNPREFAVMVAMFASLLLLIAIFIIITRSRQARRLDIEHRRYLKLSELANEYIFEYDVTHDTMSFTAEFAELIGIPPIIERYKQFFQNKSGLSEEDIDRVRALFSDMENDKSSGEFLLPTKNGEPRWFRIFCTVVRDKQGMVVAFIGKLNDIQDEKEENIRLVSRAKLDGLTGILDAAACREAISALAGVPERWPGALMIFDVDYFKNINDDLGHYSGDLVLIGIADILKSQFGKPDIIGRLGGDEFVVFIGNITSRAEAQNRAEELLNSIRLANLRSDGKAVTVSLGCVYAARAAEFDVIYKKADAALYDVKKSGRNAVKVV